MHRIGTSGIEGEQYLADSTQANQTHGSIRLGNVGSEHCTQTEAAAYPTTTIATPKKVFQHILHHNTIRKTQHL